MNAFHKLPGAPQRLWHDHAEGKAGVWYQVYETANKGKFAIWFERWKDSTLVSSVCLNDELPYLEMPRISCAGRMVRVVVEQTHQDKNAMPLFMAVSNDGGLTWQ